MRVPFVFIHKLQEIYVLKHDIDDIINLYAALSRIMIGWLESRYELKICDMKKTNDRK